MSGASAPAGVQLTADRELMAVQTESARQSETEAGPLLSVSHFNRSYGSWRAVCDVSFEIGPGVTGLLGPNGAGKSSLLTCLAGIAGWDDGQVHVAGIDLARRPRAGRGKLGFMPERVAFPADVRVEEYLRFVCTVKRIPRKERPAAVRSALEWTGLVDVRTRIVANLSKGYRQRVGLAQAVLGEPPVVILDEPTAGLDPLSVFDIRDLLQEYARDRSVLVSTHALPDARLMCDRIIVLSRGAVVYDGAPAGMVSSGGVVRARLRLRGPTGSGAPPVLSPGIELVHAQPGPDEWALVVDAEDDDALGALVRSLSVDWLVVGVEPTMDALEDAFKRAVLGPAPAAPAAEEANG